MASSGSCSQVLHCFTTSPVLTSVACLLESAGNAKAFKLKMVDPLALHLTSYNTWECDSGGVGTGEQS